MVPVRSTRGLLGLAAVVAVLCGQPAFAQQGKRVKVTVVVILANDRWKEVDPRLKCIADEVRKHDPRLRGFTLASMAWKSLAVDEQASFPLVEGRSAKVLVHTCADRHNRVCLAVTPPWQGEIVYRTVCGKFLPIVTRYQTHEHVPARTVALALGQAARPRQAHLAAALLIGGRMRERVILAVCVQPCKGN